MTTQLPLFSVQRSATSTGSRRDETHWVERLVTNFEVLTAVAGGIERLRSLVLGLAVTGKLGTSDPRDESARVLLQQIRAERAAVGHSPVQMQNPEGPRPLPRQWSWVAARDVFLVITDGDHQPPPKVERGIPFLVIGNVFKGLLNFDRTRFVPPSYHGSLAESRTPRRGDLLYTVVGSYGVAVVVGTDEPFCVQRHIAILKPSKHVDVRFFCYAMRAPVVFDQATACATGTAQKTISLSALRSFVLPLPPLAEQKRIVAKVEQFMALCDELEVKQAKPRELGDRLTKASLGALSSAEGPEELAAAWKRVAENFEELIDRPEAVKDARGSILDLAVRGGLRPRQPSADTAEEFFRALVERKRSATPSAGRRGRSFEPEGEAEPPFEVPSGWFWVLLDEIAVRVDYGTSDKPTDDPSGIPLLRMNNIQAGRVVFEPIKYVPRDADGIESLLLKPGDILFNRTNVTVPEWAS